MDNAYLTGPQGTQLNIGSWMQVDSPPDYGARDLVKQQYAQNPLVDGGAFAFESAGVRTMRFPLIVPSGGLAGLSLDTTEAWLRTLARPGGYIDLQPDGVPTAEMVRFDVLGGRVNHDQWSLPLQRVDRRKLTVELDTQPFGYWPTQIILASVASIGMPGKLAFSPVIGDAPAWLDMLIVPNRGATNWGGGTWTTDYIAWSLAAKPSMPGFLSAANMANGFGTLSGDPAAPASQTYTTPVQATSMWSGGGGNLGYSIPTGVMAAYYGRHRVYVYARIAGPSIGLPLYVSADVGLSQALASAQPIATLPGPNFVGTFFSAAATAYALLDLGEITLPRVGAPTSMPGDYPKSEQLRIWFSLPTTNPGLATSTVQVDFGGAYLIPVDGAAGILPRGLAQPSINVGQTLEKQLRLNARSREVLIQDLNQILESGYLYHRGQLPYAGASNAALDLVIGTRRPSGVATGSMVAHGGGARAGVQITYTPRFQFLKGL